MSLDRDKMFGKLPEGTIMWCLHCERTYPHGKFREVPDEDPLTKEKGVLQMCPYEDCDGDAVLDSKEWGWFREKGPGYPDVPEEGVVYSLV